MSLVHLKWLAIAAPTAFLTIVGYLLRGPVHEELHEFPGFLFVLGVLAAAVFVFSFLVFGVIARVERRVIEQNEHLSALLAVGRAGSSSLDLADTLDAALDAILSVTTADAGGVWLVTPDGELDLARQRGAGSDAFQEWMRSRIDEHLPGLAAAGRSPVAVHDLANDPRFVSGGVQELGFEAFRAQPLVRRGATVGVLAVASRSADALSSAAEWRLLMGIGEQLVISIENAQLHEQVLDTAVLEERERLARELHDSLAQVLGYVNTQTLAIEKLLSSGHSDKAEEQAAAMRKAAARVYADVREAILGLRSTRGALLPSLRSYIAEYGGMAGMPIELTVGEQVESLRLPPSAEIQLTRIIQEAVSNVHKHARASRATVTLELRDDGLEIEIADDGQGFIVNEPRRTGWPHFGLQSMRERAQAIGGTFELRSHPGSGTHVTIHVPIESPVGSAHASSAR